MGEIEEQFHANKMFSHKTNVEKFFRFFQKAPTFLKKSRQKTFLAVRFEVVFAV